MNNMASGVWGRSSAVGTSEYVIFCVGQDLRRIAAFRSWLVHNEIGHKSLVGSYNGQIEHSFIVNAVAFSRISTWTKREESVLWLGKCDARDRRRATLLFWDGTTIDLGMFSPVSRDVALGQQAWTFDPTTETYFVTEKAFERAIAA